MNVSLDNCMDNFNISENSFYGSSSDDESDSEELSRILYLDNLTVHPSVIIDNYEYKWHRQNKNLSVYWKCKHEGCNSSLTIQRGEIINPSDDHRHDIISDSEIECKKATCQIKIRCFKETTPIQEIYDDEAAKLILIVDASDIALYLPSFNKMKQNLNKIRKRTIPSLPVTVEQIDLDGEWILTSRKRRFLLFDTGATDSDRLIGYSSDNGLHVLALASQWHVDATFHASTIQFYQLMIIHGYLNGAMIPCAFILMRNKTYALYKSMFDILKEKSSSFLINLNPQRFICDFELGLIKAIRISFTSAEIKGCHFHYSQCIWKSCSNNGLKIKYCSDEKFRLWIKKLIAMAFCPIDKLDEAFEIIKNDTSCNQKLLAYFNKTWMTGSFPAKMWNHSTTIGPRTNNHVEGFHSRLKKSVGSSKPNIYKLIKLFKQIEALADIKFERSKLGDVTKRNNKYEEKDAKIRDLLDDVEHSLITLSTFLSSISPLMGNLK